SSPVAQRLLRPTREFTGPAAGAFPPSLPLTISDHPPSLGPAAMAASLGARVLRLLPLLRAGAAAGGEPLGAPQAVGALPGAPPGSPHGSHYSGYLEVPWPAGKLETFYYFAPHPDPSRPLVAWMNGGPGASSVVGLFAELGPLLLNARSAPRPGRDGWELFANPDGWGAEGSLLAWEQPAGVGFSRCPGCGDWNDTSATMASHAFLLAFYEAFPAERSRPLFIAGESYGGIYVPLLANQVHLHNSKAAEAIPLRGVAIGNGCIGFGVSGACGTDSLELLVEVLETAAPGVDRSLLAQVRHACRGELDKGLGPADLSTACRSAFKELEEEIGDYNNALADHFGSPCGPDEQGNWGDGSAFSCGSMAATRSYFNDLEVQRALHAVPASATEALKWTTWDGDAPFYNITVADAQPVYRALLAANYSMLIYPRGGGQRAARHLRARDRRGEVGPPRLRRAAAPTQVGRAGWRAGRARHGVRRRPHVRHDRGRGPLRARGPPPPGAGHARGLRAGRGAPGVHRQGVHAAVAGALSPVALRRGRRGSPGCRDAGGARGAGLMGPPRCGPALRRSATRRSEPAADVSDHKRK
ncbi:unnamed protein product, partial [Prorocentrum cordatum]